nr:MAG TPA: hypothetical protein [Caudoviricetes sp.]
MNLLQKNPADFFLPYPFIIKFLFLFLFYILSNSIYI